MKEKLSFGLLIHKVKLKSGSTIGSKESDIFFENKKNVPLSFVHSPREPVRSSSTFLLPSSYTCQYFNRVHKFPQKVHICAFHIMNIESGHIWAEQWIE